MAVETVCCIFIIRWEYYAVSSGSAWIVSLCVDGGSSCRDLQPVIHVDLLQSEKKLRQESLGEIFWARSVGCHLAHPRVAPPLFAVAPSFSHHRDDQVYSRQDRPAIDGGKWDDAGRQGGGKGKSTWPAMGLMQSFAGLKCCGANKTCNPTACLVAAIPCLEDDGYSGLLGWWNWPVNHPCRARPCVINSVCAGAMAVETR